MVVNQFVGFVKGRVRLFHDPLVPDPTLHYLVSGDGVNCAGSQ